MRKHFILTLGLLIAFIFLAHGKITIRQADSLLKNKSYEMKEKILDSLIQKYNISNPTLGLRLSKKYANLVQHSADTIKLGNSKFNLGQSYEMLGEFDKALEYLFAARELLSNTNQKKTLALIYNEIGLVYTEQPGIELKIKAFEFYRKFLSLAEEMGDQMEIAGAYSNIGWLHGLIKNYDSSLHYHQKALHIRKALGDKRTIGISYSNLGHNHMMLGDFDRAGSFLKKALAIYEEIEYDWGIYETRFDLAHLFLKTKDFNSSYQYLNQLLKIGQKLQSNYVYQKIYYLMTDYYQQTRDYSNAYEYLELSYAYKDSLTTESIKSKLARMETLYELDKKEQTITLLERESQIRKMWVITIIIASVILLSVGGYSFFLVSAKRRKEKALFETEKQLQHKNQELINEKLEKSKLKEKELQNEVEYKSRQLTTHALNMMQKNKLLQELKSDLIDMSKKTQTALKPEVKRIQLLIDRNLKSENDWNVFKMYFEQVNPGFFTTLSEKYPSLTTYDHRLCALIKLNLNIKEAASVLNVAPNSIKSARYRLRKKFDMEESDNLGDFIREVS